MDRKELFELCTHGPWRTAGHETQYRIVPVGSRIVLAFQGSSQDIDWKYNFAFVPQPYNDMPWPWRAHGGFVRAWQAAREKILDEIESVNGAGIKIVIVTGYSHGAALAVMAYEDLKWHGYAVEGVNFGGPRVMWMPCKQVRSRFDTFERIKVSGDIVTGVPLWLMGFRHVGKKTRLGRWRLPGVKPHMPGSYVDVL